MPNYWGRSGAPMIQPTKDELRQWLSEARADAKQQRMLRRNAECQLGVATRKLGQLVLEGKITLPVEKIGQLVVDAAMDEEAAQAQQKLEKLSADTTA